MVQEAHVSQLTHDKKAKAAPAKTWCVYVLRCADSSLYTGISNNAARRLQQHNAGTASRYTRSRLPVTMVYQEPQDSHSSALKRELAIKAYSRKAKEELIQQGRVEVVSN
ncbi:MAG: GIY-YIG nuclease family protein [Planctomycetota bacterium]|nr:MAG: GIY-YIG nuclease family protein [Planctomycetota bacterium]